MSRKTGKNSQERLIELSYEPPNRKKQLESSHITIL